MILSTFSYEELLRTMQKAAGILKERCEGYVYHNQDAVTRKAKKEGFSDKAVAELWGMSEQSIFEMRKQHGIFPVYKMIDTCASEFEKCSDKTDE